MGDQRQRPREGSGVDPGVDATWSAQDSETPGDIDAAPSRIRHFAVLSVLGRGAMGTVYSAFDEALDRRVAIKVLHPRSGVDGTERLTREAQAMAKLSHPNVGQIYEVGHTRAGRLFLAMEYVKGQTLDAWVEAEPRTWEAIVDVYVQAGRGLAAAHAVGLVHRDFKPDNAMLGDDGRVRVLDFGLARAIRRKHGEHGDPDAPAPTAFHERTLEIDDRSQASAAGRLVGTPAYMSPEQFCGQPADAKTDQFSFCVALYEALFGHRPFAGESVAAIAFNVTTGAPLEPDGGAAPSWLRRVVLRGLSTKAEDRYPSMDALLDELARKPVNRRARVMMSVGVLALVASLIAGVGVWRQRQAALCRDAEAHLDGVWDDARRASVRSAVLGTDLSYAASTWERVEDQLDAYADDWIAARTEACEATAVRGEQSTEVMDLRMACLDRALLQTRALVGVLEGADEEVVERAVSAVSKLPELSLCSDVHRLRAQVAPPTDLETAREVEALDAELATAQALYTAGKYAEGRARTVALVDRAEATGYEPIVARVSQTHGDLTAVTADYAGAEAIYRRGYLLALRHGMTEVAADLAARQADLVGRRMGRFDEGRWWGELGLAHAESAESIAAEARALVAIGTIELGRGRFDEARAAYQRALPLRREFYGADHQNVAFVINGLGLIDEGQGDLSAARARYEQALGIWEDVLGPDHPNVSASLNNLANVDQLQGAFASARAHHERALDIRRRAHGPEHPDVGVTLNNLGSLAAEERDFDTARDHYAQALRIFELRLGEQHPYVVHACNGLGLAQHRLGDLEGARTTFERGLKVHASAFGEPDALRAELATGLGETLVDLGDPAGARELLEDALASLADSPAPLRARAEFALATALIAEDSASNEVRARARDLARSAREAYLAVGDSHAKEVERIDAWLAGQSG